MKKIFILTLVMVFGLASVCFAGIEQGKSEVGANYTRQDVDGIVISMVNFNYGYFMTDELQLSGNLMLMEAEDFELIGLDGQAKYHLIQEGSEIVPYVGAQLGNVSISGPGFSESATSYGFMGGAKYFVSEDASVNVEYNYKNVMYEGGDITITTLSVGMSVYF